MNVVAKGVWRGAELHWIVSDGREIEEVSDTMLRTIAGRAQRYPFDHIDVVRQKDVIAYWRNRMAALEKIGRTK